MSLLAQMGMMMGKAGGEKPPAYDEWTIHSNGEPQTSLIQSFGSIPDGYAVVCFAYKSDLKPTFTIELNGNPLEIHDTHEFDAQIGAVVAYTDAQFSDSDPNILDIQSDEPFFNVYGRLLPIDYLPEEAWRASDNGTGSSAVLGTELAEIFGSVAIDDIQERKPETAPIATHYWGVGKTGTDIPLDVPVIPAGSAWSYSGGEYSRIDQGAMSETLELSFSVPTAGEVAINLDYRPNTNAELYIELVDSTLAKTKRLVMAVGNSQLLMGNPTKTYTRLNLIGKGELAVSVATQEPDETTVGGVQRGEDEQIQLIQASPNYFSFAAIGLKQAAQELWTPIDLGAKINAFFTSDQNVVAVGTDVTAINSQVDTAAGQYWRLNGGSGARPQVATGATGKPVVRIPSANSNGLNFGHSGGMVAQGIINNKPALWSFGLYDVISAPSGVSYFFFIDNGSLTLPRYAMTQKDTADNTALQTRARRLTSDALAVAGGTTPALGMQMHFACADYAGNRELNKANGAELTELSSAFDSGGGNSQASNCIYVPTVMTGGGSGARITGDFYCFMLGYGAIPTAAEIEKIEGWAAWHFNAVSRLPIGHPYKLAPPYK